MKTNLELETNKELRLSSGLADGKASVPGFLP